MFYKLNFGTFSITSNEWSQKRHIQQLVRKKKQLYEWIEVENIRMLTTKSAKYHATQKTLSRLVMSGTYFRSILYRSFFEQTDKIYQKLNFCIEIHGLIVRLG